jgi:hypothetical protein
LGIDMSVDAAASVALAMPIASASFLARCASFDFACSSARKSETARAAAALDGSFTARKPAPGRSRSESNAPRGSAAIAVIESREVAKTESVQSERCRFFSPRVQRKFLRSKPTPQMS